MVVTPFSLVTTALLLSPVKGFTVSLIREDVERLYRYLRFTGATLADTIGPLEEIEKTIRYVNDSYLDDGIVRRLSADEQPEGGKDEAGSSGETIYIIDEDSRGRINFNKNSIIHLLLPLAYFSLAFLLSEKDGIASENKVREHYGFLSDLFSDSFVYTDFLIDRENSFSITAKYLTESGDLEEDSHGWSLKQEKSRSALHFYATAIRDYLESCSIVCSALSQHESDRVNRRDLTLEIRRNGVRMYHLGEVGMSESLSMPNYNNILDHLIREKGLIEEDGIRHAIIRPGDFSRVERLSEEVRNALRVLS
jgi:glycerol-3-phosphate O-acyltransferase